MDPGTVDSWLDSYGRAWERLDANAAAALFAKGSTYQWGPFEEPLQGREAIRERWKEAVTRQRDVSFAHEVLAVVEDRAIARWSCSLMRTDTGVRYEMDGIFDLSLTEDGACSRFREWWNGRELS